MCMTDDGDALLETARRIQAERKCKPAIIPVRDEVDVALSTLLVLIEDAQSALDDGVTAYEVLKIIMRAKLRYDAARLAKGDRTLPVLSLPQSDEQEYS